MHEYSFLHISLRHQSRVGHSLSHKHLWNLFISIHYISYIVWTLVIYKGICHSNFSSRTRTHLLSLQEEKKNHFIVSFITRFFAQVFFLFRIQFFIHSHFSPSITISNIPSLPSFSSSCHPCHKIIHLFHLKPTCLLMMTTSKATTMPRSTRGNGQCWITSTERDWRSRFSRSRRSRGRNRSRSRCLSWRRSGQETSRGSVCMNVSAQITSSCCFKGTLSYL